MPGRKKSGKNAPILSHEFIITNHGDIVSCGCMVFMVGLMFQVTSKAAAVFIAPQHNITRTINESNEQTVTYTNGPKDFCTIFFYSMAWIVVHAILQEYIWDKVTRKLHLSKTKNTKFNDSGALLPFYLGFACWGTDIIMKEQYIPNITKIWEGYPHNEMPFILKFYFILQLAYWVHCLPELYFTRAKKEEMFPKIQLYVEYLLFIWAAYMLNFTHVALCCLVIHYLVESIYHAMRMIHIAGQEDLAANLFYVWSLLFVIARFAIIALTVMTFWYGLPRLENAGLNVDTGNYNTPLVRVIAMSGALLMQAWLAWNFIRFQIKRWRENAPQVTSPAKKREPRKKGKKENDKKKKEDLGEESEEAEIIEKIDGETKNSPTKVKKA